MQGLLVQIISQ